MHKERLAYLLKQYLDNLITKDEFDELLLHLENEEIFLPIADSAGKNDRAVAGSG